MKLIIPVAGKGTRLYPHTLVTPKPLLNVAGKPIIHHVIDRFSGLDIDEIIFVIAPGGEPIVDYVSKEFKNYKISIAYQDKPLGLGHAVYQGVKNVDDSSAMVVLGDTIFEADIKRYVESSRDFVIVKNVANPKAFGVVEVADGKIVGMEEKPDMPQSNLAIIGVYFFSELDPLRKALEHIIENGIKTRGEYQLTDALKKMLDNGWRPEPVMADLWLDCGRHDSLLEANRILLRKSVKKVGVELLGTSVVIHPVYIGSGVVLENSVIGPYVSIGDSSRIENSVVSNSIVNADVEIYNAVVRNSIISGQARLEGKPMELQLGGFSMVKV